MIPEHKVPTLDQIIPLDGQLAIESVGSIRHQAREGLEAGIEATAHPETKSENIGHVALLETLATE